MFSADCKHIFYLGKAFAQGSTIWEGFQEGRLMRFWLWSQALYYRCTWSPKSMTCLPSFASAGMHLVQAGNIDSPGQCSQLPAACARRSEAAILQPLLPA